MDDQAIEKMTEVANNAAMDILDDMKKRGLDLEKLVPGDWHVHLVDLIANRIAEVY
jgi:hypothetical protein